METYPIVINGDRAGTLRREQRGLMTAFTAEMTDMGALVRLSVYGGGQEGYLGVMAPDGSGKLRLEKSFSRAGMVNMPAEPEYAGPAGEKPAAPERPEEPEPERESGQEQAEAPVEADQAEQTREERPYKGDLLWFSAPDGSLVSFDGRRTLLALPADGSEPPRGVRSMRRKIAGRDYIVFPR